MAKAMRRIRIAATVYGFIVRYASEQAIEESEEGLVFKI